MVNRRQLLKLGALATASFAAPLAYSASKITMAFNTDNPIGSTSSKDLSDNARNLDYLVNGEDTSYPDRKGVLRKSWKGMEGEHNADQVRRKAQFDNAQSERVTEFNDFLESSGYETPVDYAPGINVARPTQQVRYLLEIYRPKDDALPFVTSNFAADEAKWISNGQNSLRQELAEPEGGGMLGWERNALTVAVAVAPTIKRAMDATPVSLWEFIGSITYKPDLTDMSTWDWSPAFNAMYRYIADTYTQAGLRYGKSAYIPGGTYKTFADVISPRTGIATIGEGPLTSVIEVASNSTATWAFLARNEVPSGNMGGTCLINLGINCAGVNVGGLNIEDAYDNVVLDNVRISRVHALKIGLRLGPRTDGFPGMSLSQTITARNLFVYKNAGASTVPPIVLIKVQEAQFIGCKSWAGSYGGAGRGNTSAWYLEDCRSVHLQDCSAVGAQNFGVEVRAQTKTSDGIHFTNMLYENCNGTLKTSSSNAAAFPLKTCTHTLPRLEYPISGGYDLGGLYESIVDVGPLLATLQADTDQNRIFAQRLQNVTDLAVGLKRNVVDAHPNTLDSYCGSSREIRIVRPSTPMMSLGTTTSADYTYWEYSKSEVADNGFRQGVNKGGIFIPLFRGDDTRSFIGPARDNALSLGHPAFRAAVIYSVTGTINTSDAREKTPIRKLTQAEVAAAIELSAEIGVYKWLDAVAEKGEEARGHVGMTVQRAIEIMEFHELDPFGYGFICYDEWDDSYETAQAEYKEIDGETVLVKPEDLRLISPAGNRFSFRMDELSLFLMAGAHAQNRILSDRLDALERAAKA